MLMILAITIHNIPGKSCLSVCPSSPARGQPLPRVGAILGGSYGAAAVSPFFFLLPPCPAGARVPLDEVPHGTSCSLGRAEPPEVLAANPPPPTVRRGLGGSLCCILEHLQPRW